MHKDFEAEGAIAIQRGREADPTGYLRVISSVMPKHSEKKITHDVQKLTDDELFNYVKELRDNIGTAAGAGRAREAAKDKARLN